MTPALIPNQEPIPLAVGSMLHALELHIHIHANLRGVCQSVGRPNPLQKEALRTSAQLVLGLAEQAGVVLDGRALLLYEAQQHETARQEIKAMLDSLQWPRNVFFRIANFRLIRRIHQAAS